ncbi:MAG TPA: hypothetical protein VK151_17680 [Fluviicola sp.]|nr:hypothetical protein [Fluviicola sp.]
MKKRFVATLLATLLLGGIAYSQESIHSGVIHTTANGEENNLIKIHCDALTDQTLVDVINTEFAKYPKEIKSADFDPVNHKILIKYSNAIDPNMILGILERVYIKAYYHNVNGVPVYYTKAGNETFKR